MPRYDAKRIEAKWQAYWDAHQTFRIDAVDPAKPKTYVLDMFPYPSGSGLHVGHPEGYTATDIVCRYSRMRGKQVLHPMGWDAFGLPAEDYAIKTGTHPAVTTAKNIETFKRQLKSLGFSYDWSREFATTDPDYYRWTQWIFLQLFDTWYDAEHTWAGPDGVKRTGKGRPISELPIPADVASQGQEAVRRYQDKHRLAYQHEAPVNWCPALGTVLANEEIVDGKSERGGHPVERVPLRQWLLRITAYADRLANELEDLNWPDSIKLMQRNWIGRSEGAEVDFFIGSLGRQPSSSSAASRSGGRESPESVLTAQSVAQSQATLVQGTHVPRSEENAFEEWKASRAKTGFPKEPGDDVLRIYTTRPDTLFGVTFMVLAPEHPSVDRLTTSDRRAAVDEYRRQASMKSDLDRTDLAKEKSGVFTGGYAVNPINGEQIPVWIADYVLISYGTGAIMAVPAHDERDFEFACRGNIPIVPVIEPTDDWLVQHQHYTGLSEEAVQKELARNDWELTQDHHSVVFARIKSIRDFIASVWADRHDASRLEQTLRAFHRSSPWCFGSAMTEYGVAINSDSYNGLATQEFKTKITNDLADAGLGKIAVNYRLRDWLFSRQRYWGEPFPIWHELDANGEPTGLMRTETEVSTGRLNVEHVSNVLSTTDHQTTLETCSTADASVLPVRLPEMADFKPTGTPEPMLSKAPAEWLFKTDADGVRLKRETNTMPQWAGSCWYYLRFADPKNDQQFLDPAIEKAWLPVDLYVGGAEHAVLHLLYSRFWHKVLFDRGHVSTVEPFQRLVNQGMILGEADENGRAEKMSKSRGNVINPDDVVHEYGADSLRLYEMFMGPLEAVKPWSMKGVEGVSRFLGRVWRMIADEQSETDVRLNPAIKDVAPTAAQLRVLHHTIKIVTRDIESLGFNTAISRMMEFVNEFLALEVRPRAVIDPFVLLLSPFAPHMAEEMWELLGHATTLAYEPWPLHDEKYLVETEIEIPVQINGKLRGKVKVPADADQATLEAAATIDAAIAPQLEGKTIVKVIVVPGKMVNFVVR